MISVVRLAVSQFDFKKRKSIVRGVISAILISSKINDKIFGIAIDQYEKDRGKLKDAVDMLIKGGYKKSQISYIFSPSITTYVWLKRTLTRLPKIFYWVVIYGAKVRDGYEIFTVLLSNMVKDVIIDKDVALLVVSDVSPNRYAFWIAFESCRKKIIWLQHSFDLRPVPGVMFKVDYALLKSNAGMDFITKNLESGASVKYYCDTNAYKTTNISIPQRVNTVGIGVNAWFDPKGEVLSKIKSIIDVMGMHSVNLLLHPRTTKVIVEKCKKNHIFNLIDNNEDFFRESDLIIVGNSQLQIDVLMSGKPVIHTGGIDFEDYDRMEYCRMGIVWGSDKLKPIDLEDLSKFYSSSLFSDKFSSFLSNQKLVVGTQPIQYLQGDVKL